MREFLIKTFARLFAVLGCSTLVTACYGVPYDSFDAKVSGRVTDSQTAQPVKGILVRMTVGSRSQMGDMQSRVCLLSHHRGMPILMLMAGSIRKSMFRDFLMELCLSALTSTARPMGHLPDSRVYPLETEDLVEFDIDLKAY